MQNQILKTQIPYNTLMLLVCITTFIFLINNKTLADTKVPNTSINFTKEVLPILKKHCFECHSGSKHRGGLRLDTEEGIKTGGTSGLSILINKPNESLLIHRIQGDKGLPRMPLKAEALSQKQIDILRVWISQGAIISKGSLATNVKTGEDHWSLQAIKKPLIPTVPDAFKPWVQNPIDAFVLEKLQAKGLKPASQSEPRILARRIFIDLTGLPPTPVELEAFCNDNSPAAYEKLVDKLLASPRYGERWARHWLDVAHYADSHGQDQDRFRPNAWPFRDFLIRSFNEDKPYARFIKEQIAGDGFFPDEPQAIIATGFLAAGPWDESGLMGINENSIDRQIAHYLDRDDIVTSTMTTFTGLTVHCARCHDHKFDPISQVDYYGLQAVFAGIDKAERLFDADEKVAKKRISLHAELNRIRTLKDKIYPSSLSNAQLTKIDKFEKEYQVKPSLWFTPTPETWNSKNGASLKLLADQSILSSGNNPEKDTYAVTLSTLRTGLTGLRLELLADDSLPHKGPGRNGNGNLHLSEIKIFAGASNKLNELAPVKIKAAIADFDQAGWGISRAIDGNPSTAWGIYPEVGKPHQALFEFEKPISFEPGITLKIELDQVHGGSHLIGRFRISLTTATSVLATERPLPPEIVAVLRIDKKYRSELERAKLTRWVLEQSLESELASLPVQMKVYCGTNQFKAEGSFKPSLVPRVVQILKRGEITKPTGLATPSAIGSITNLDNSFKFNDLNDERQRRMALADWISHEKNPLTWRVMANRIWHYHFHKGIVDTPNDFGKMGGVPTHPELLDWLASSLLDSKGSIKALHKLILTSNTYKQKVRNDAFAATVDADNRLLWRMNLGRLDAETLRDSILQASGRIDQNMYGTPVKHFIMKPGIHVTPEADYDRFDVDSSEAQRRSIYRYIFRTRPDPMLEALDCPDASQSSPVRSASISATQALVLWNNKFMLRYAEHLAKLSEQAGPKIEQQISVLCQRLLLRLPTEVEQSAWGNYANKYGLANLIRILFNSSEFLFIE